jgi:uncharacterized OB-fold protein
MTRLYNHTRYLDALLREIKVKCPVCKRVFLVPNNVRCPNCGADLAPWEPLIVKEGI